MFLINHTACRGREGRTEVERKVSQICGRGSIRNPFRPSALENERVAPYLCPLREEEGDRGHLPCMLLCRAELF